MDLAADVSVTDLVVLTSCMSFDGVYILCLWNCVSVELSLIVCGFSGWHQPASSHCLHSLVLMDRALEPG